MLPVDVPYRAQFASRGLIGEIIRRERRIEDDPRWQESGAASPAEYRVWAMTGCGMACLQMILGAAQLPVPKFVDLCKQCESYGGYRKKPDAPGYDGLFYAEFCEFVAERFGIEARIAAPMPVVELRQTVSDGALVMASVHHSIRDPSAVPPGRGGHLVLVTASGDGMVRLHNPSGSTADSQENVWLDDEVFARFYADRGIVVTVPASR